MKDTGFISLLNYNEYKPKNVGFIKDKEGRRGASALIYINGESYAIWFLQRDFPTGIYTCCVTVVPACIIHPVLAYYEGRDLNDLMAFISGLKEQDLTETIYDFVQPWTELQKRVMLV